MQNKNITIITSSVITVMLIGLTIVSVVLESNKPKGDPVNTQTTPKQQSEISMEDGRRISSDDIRLEKNMRYEATKAIKQYILDMSPRGSHIATCSNEWYVTEENDDFNVLARCIVSYTDSPSERLLFVARLTLDDKSDEIKVIDIYRPDGRYDI